MVIVLTPFDECAIEIVINIILMIVIVASSRDNNTTKWMGYFGAVCMLLITVFTCYCILQ